MKKILAVDDDPNIIELITSIFSARGFEVLFEYRRGAST